MAFMHENYFCDTTSPEDFIYNDVARRIGTRIRQIREERKLTQTELGTKVGLSADRIQKYENGFRKPKLDMLKNIASALDVSPVALLDPVINNELGVMYALFDLEEMFDLQITKTNGTYYLYFSPFSNKSHGVIDFIEEWYNEKQSVERRLETLPNERAKITKEYFDWKENFPDCIVDKTLKIEMKKHYEEAIAELQKKIKALDE